jgi:hypothetical protein
LSYAVLIFISVALLLAVIALARERRLRLALQQILKRFLERWRAHEDTQVSRDQSRFDQHTDDKRL